MYVMFARIQLSNMPLDGIGVHGILMYALSFSLSLILPQNIKRNQEIELSM